MNVVEARGLGQRYGRASRIWEDNYQHSFESPNSQAMCS